MQIELNVKEQMLENVGGGEMGEFSEWVSSGLQLCPSRINHCAATVFYLTDWDPSWVKTSWTGLAEQTPTPAGVGLPALHDWMPPPTWLTGMPEHCIQMMMRQHGRLYGPVCNLFTEHGPNCVLEWKERSWVQTLVWRFCKETKNRKNQRCIKCTY